MMVTEVESRRRARELLLAINGAVDGLMARHGVGVPGDATEALIARASFLEGYTGARVDGRKLRSSYVHLHETLGDMSAEPIPLDAEYEERAVQFLSTVEAA